MDRGEEVEYDRAGRNLAVDKSVVAGTRLVQWFAPAHLETRRHGGKSGDSASRGPILRHSEAEL